MKIKKILSLLILSAYFFIGSNSAFAINLNGGRIWDNFKDSVKNQFEGKGLKDDMIVGEKNDSLISGNNSADLSLGVEDRDSVNFSDNFIKVIERYIFGLVGIVAVSVFIYISYMLFTAEGKEDEFKKAIKALAYAIVGLAIIPLSYIVVRIITGFNF